MKLINKDYSCYAIVEDTDDINGDFITDKDGKEYQIHYSDASGKAYTLINEQSYLLTSQLMIDAKAV